MLRMILKRFEELGPRTQVLLCIASITLLGALDHFSGWEISFSIFYLMPISMGSWYISARWGVTLAFLCALTWLVTDFTAGHQYSHPVIPLWNATVRLGFFVLTSRLLSTLRMYTLDQERQARHDSLTGLLNSRAFNEEAERLLALARRQGASIALAYLDLDDFKTLNDTMGHSEGDRALMFIAQALSRTVRKTDICARLGGDEFAILLFDAGESESRDAVMRTHAEINRTIKEEKWPIGVTVGTVIFEESPPALGRAIAAADQLMYRIKANAKNSVGYSIYRA